MRNTVIRFRNMKAVRVGKGIKELRRQQSNLSSKQLADKCGITESYLNRLEEGFELEVESATLEKIAQALGICGRGTLPYEQLVDQFLYIAKCVAKDDQVMLI